MKMSESYHFLTPCSRLWIELSQFFEKTVVKLVSSDFHLIYFGISVCSVWIACVQTGNTTWLGQNNEMLASEGSKYPQKHVLTCIWQEILSQIGKIFWFYLICMWMLALLDNPSEHVYLFQKIINNSREKYKRNECLINVCKSDKDLSWFT
jgi:hypothetical protein